MHCFFYIHVKLQKSNNNSGSHRSGNTAPSRYCLNRLSTISGNDIVFFSADFEEEGGTRTWRKNPCFRHDDNKDDDDEHDSDEEEGQSWFAGSDFSFS